MNTNNLNRIVRRVVNESHLLTEGPYCNPDGADPSTVPGCQEHGVGCLHMGGGYFGTMSYNPGSDSYECGMVRPGGTGGGPLRDDELVIRTKGNSPEEDNCPEGLWNPVSRHCFGKKEARNTYMMGESVIKLKESQLLTEDYYCNEGGRAINGPRCMRCAQGGGACPCIGDGYFDYLKYNGGGHETGWSCGSVRPPDDYEYDKEFDREIDVDIDRPVRMAKRGMRESDFSRVVKRAINEREELHERYTCWHRRGVRSSGKHSCGRHDCGSGDWNIPGHRNEYGSYFDCRGMVAPGTGGGGIDRNYRDEMEEGWMNEEPKEGDRRVKKKKITPWWLGGIEVDKCWPDCGKVDSTTSDDEYQTDKLMEDDATWTCKNGKCIKVVGKGGVGEFETLQECEDSNCEERARPGGYGGGRDYSMKAMDDTQALNEAAACGSKLYTSCSTNFAMYTDYPGCHEEDANGNCHCKPGKPWPGDGKCGGSVKIKGSGNNYMDLDKSLEYEVGDDYGTIGKDLYIDRQSLNEDVVKSRRLMGYNTSLTLTEQATGGNTPICMGITAQGCPGTPGGNAQMTTPTNKCATIDNVPVTANDVGRDIMAPMGGQHMTVQSVFPNVNGNGSSNVTSAPGPCPRTTGGSTSGSTGTSTCNKSCQQLVPNFKQTVVGKSCGWLNNRLNAFTQKLQTKKPGSCGAKRISCKIGVIQQNLQNLSCQ